MANYYEMMRDTVGAYGEGVDIARRRRAEDERAARERAEFDQRQREWDAANQQRQEVRDAMAGLRATQDGVLQQQDTGMPAPSAQMLYRSGYGGATGAQAIRDAAGDGIREQARMGLQRTMDPGAAIQTRPATDVEVNRAAQRVALAKQDLAAWGQLESNTRDLALKAARREEFQRINKMSEKDLVSLFQQSINANPDVPAMVDFDPKTRKFLVVSQVPGVPSQSLSRAEMIQSVMGLWETGNGDYGAGIQAVISGAQNQRALQDKQFERSRGMAKDNAGLYFEGRKADNDDRRTANDSARLGLARSEAQRRAEMEKFNTTQAFVNEKGDVVQMYAVTTPKGVEWREMPMPAGLKPLPKGGRTGAPREVPAEGTVLQDGEEVYKSDGRGGKLHPDAPVPSQRPAILKAAGLTKQEIEQVQWHPRGMGLLFNGKAYTLDPQAMAQLRQDIATEGARKLSIREEEAALYTPPPYESTAPTPLGRGHVRGESLGLTYR